jgi:RNA polymerase sigma-70 factor (ECF subfamily)
MDEAGLISSAQQGDLDAFNHLVVAHQDLAYNLALRMLNDKSSAEDATQTAFISAYRHIHQFRGGSFKAWVLRMVTNSCYDELRRRQRHPSQSLEPADPETDDEMESPSWMMDAHTRDPQGSFEQQELEHALVHCLEKLPKEFRAVVVMADLEGLDYQEVSEAVRIPLGTIKSRLARARLKLRECLQGFGELLPEKFRLQGEGTI